MTITEFTQLGEQYLPAMEAQALRLTNDPHRAKDLLQEAAYSAYKNRQQFRPGTSFLAWAQAIIRNTFFSSYRQQKRRGDLLKATPIHDSWSTREVTYNPAEGTMGAEKIMELVQGLPVIFRHPFLLHYEGVKYREISLRLGIPVGTAKSRVFTARQILKKQIDALYRIAG
ncbi:RNA polymerase sigma factor [Lewinella sp. 4G2]|uniref:RNA polymerase sigma factor n=1 Tax=Lewinella sp. 4G2 TaxID=1803372 RepID=UPI0007B4D51E|nr:RNA polymerase sigma factor [Lewinella sp. 4G2]OAV43684.1 hypothetical protein A3850_003855 [Lewinella sp. 4G2]